MTTISIASIVPDICPAQLFKSLDDVLNLTGDAGRDGKEINGDLLEGKRTLVSCMRSVRRTRPIEYGSEVSLTALESLAREVLQLRQILPKSGRIEWTGQSAIAFAEAAKREFDKAAFAGVPARLCGHYRAAKRITAW
jgi:geranylgeranyl diphosphate synthase type II